MRYPAIVGVSLLAASAVLSACESGGGEVLTVDATGSAAALVFLDRNGDGVFTSGVDAPVPGVEVRLVRGERKVVARDTTDAQGIGILTGVPVGSYGLSLDSLALGDSVQLSSGRLGEVVVARGDTVRAVFPVQYPLVTVADARRLTGKVVAVRGVALNDPASFQDLSVHLSDSTGAIRASFSRPPQVAVGDSVRLVGRVAAQDGQPVLIDPVVVALGKAQPPAPHRLNTRTAATAQDGSLAASLVRVDSAEVLDFARPLPSGDLLITVDDDSGPLEVVLDPSARITSPVPVAPGTVASITGVLVPGENGRWQLKPRATADLTVGARTYTIDQIRSLPRQRLVSVEGVALNGWATFSDRSVHLADATGAVRIGSVAATSLQAGHAARLLAWTEIVNGHPALTQQGLSRAPEILDRSRPAPTPVTVRAGEAAAARVGTRRLDWQLVRVVGARVGQAANALGTGQFTVVEGSDTLVVQLDREAGMVPPAGLIPDASVEVTGLLVPLPGGQRWFLRPRSSSEVSVGS